MNNIQIAKIIFLSSLSIMKKILNLAEFKLGKNSDDFKYFKSKTMDYTYEGLQKLFSNLESKKVVKKCKCKHSLRKGYSDCECGGSGYINR